MDTIWLLEAYNIYGVSTLILGVESLIMGITLIILRKVLKNGGERSKSGLTFLVLAMFTLSIINLLEYLTGTDCKDESISLSIVISAASIELFLIFSACVSMLCKHYITKRRIYIELGCIALFTIPAILASLSSHQLLFNTLFGVSIAYYCIKSICNYLEFRKLIIKIKAKMENCYSDNNCLWLNWINNTFRIALVMVVASMIVPMTNYTVLAIYNYSIIFAFLYIYISVIRNIYMFDMSMLKLENEDVENSVPKESLHKYSSTVVNNLKPIRDEISARQKLVNDWMTSRGYAEAGITATEVAAQLKTTRPRLSAYLKTEHNATYYEWIASLRIEDAKRQLIEYPNRAVYEIALNVGIEDRDNFRHAFQRYTGVSPTTYRKENTEWK